MGEAGISDRIKNQDERVHISLGAVCNNNCVFCMEEDRDARYVNNSAMTAERVKWILDSHAGAEGLLHQWRTDDQRKHAIRSVGESAWVPHISVMTNGRRLGYMPYAVALAKAGMNRFYISIHGHNAKLHDGLTRTPTSFVQTLAGIDAIAKMKRFGVQLHTSTVITKRNVPHFTDIYRFLREHGVDQVVFNVMQANGRANTFFEQIFPSYTEIAQHFREFIAAQRAVGEKRSEAFLVDIPLCTTEGIPDYNRGYVEKYRHFDLADTAGLPVEQKSEREQDGKGKGLVLLTRSDLDDQQRSKRAECATCRYNHVCEGVWRNYTRRNGWDEMVPVDPASGSTETGPQADVDVPGLSSSLRFVGAGAVG
ncbi:MAG: radical SAM protein HxsC4 [Polyangiaceae bacterium]